MTILLYQKIDEEKPYQNHLPAELEMVAEKTDKLPQYGDSNRPEKVTCRSDDDEEKGQNIEQKVEE